MRAPVEAKARSKLPKACRSPLVLPKKTKSKSVAPVTDPVPPTVPEVVRATVVEPARGAAPVRVATAVKACVNAPVPNRRLCADPDGTRVRVVVPVRDPSPVTAPVGANESV